MARLGPLLLKGAGALLLAFVALGVIATVVGILLSIVATVVAAVVTLAVVVLFVLAAVGLFSLFRDGNDGESDFETAFGYDADRSTTDTDPEERLRSRYVEGELTDAEFERELDRLLEDDRGRTDGFENRSRRSRDSTTATDRTRLWDR